MNETPDTSFMARTFGQNWSTTAPGILFIIGMAISGTFDSGTIHKVGLLLSAIGGGLVGINARSAKVTSAQMEAVKPPAPLPPVPETKP